MSILIPGMKMPTGRPIRIEITADGAVREIIDPFLVIPSGNAIELPPHGDLIDREKIPFVESENGCQDDYAFCYDINEMTPVIPAEEGEI